MSSLEERQKIIKEIIKPAFKQAGFKTSGNHFVKHEDGFIKVFSVDNSSWNNKDCVSFTLRLGILFPLIEQIVNRKIHKFPSASDCHFEINSNQLNNSSRLFEIKPDTEIAEFRQYSSYVINNHVIPFFKNYTDIRDCTDLYKKYISNSFDIKPFIGLTLIDKGHIDAGLKLMQNLNPSYIESFRKQLLDHRDFLLSKHK
jgi:hypothetical protein